MALITNSAGQIQFDVAVQTPGHTADVQALRIVPGTEGGRKIAGQIYVDLGGLLPVRLDFVLTYADIAFAEYDAFGSKIDAKERAKLAQKF